MEKISISRCVSGAWDLTTKHWIMCIIVLVVGIVVSLVSQLTAPTVVYNTTGNMTPEEAQRMLSTVILNSFGASTLIGYIVQYAIYAGLYKMALNGYNGLKVDTSAYKMPLATYVKFIAANIVYGILVVIGLFLCVIPGIVIGIGFMFVPLIILDEPETEFIAAFKKSWHMACDNLWVLFLLGIVATLINFVGLICCCVGVIFTVVMSIFMMVIAYYALKDDAPVVEPEQIETI